MKNGATASWKRRTASAPTEAEEDHLAIRALTFIASDPDRAHRFFAVSGLVPGDLRKAAADPAFLTGVMDYLLGDEPLLMAFAEAASLDPEAVVRTQDGRQRG